MYNICFWQPYNNVVLASYDFARKKVVKSMILVRVCSEQVLVDLMTGPEIPTTNTYSLQTFTHTIEFATTLRAKLYDTKNTLS